MTEYNDVVRCPNCGRWAESKYDQRKGGYVCVYCYWVEPDSPSDLDEEFSKA